MKGKRRRARKEEYLVEGGGYTTNKTVAVSKLPKGPGPGATKAPRNSKKK